MRRIETVAPRIGPLGVGSRERMNAPLEGHEVRLRGLGGEACTASPAPARPQPGPVLQRRGRHHALAVAALLALGTSGCDPLWSMRLRQPLGPASSADCVDRAVASIPRLTVQGRVGHERAPGGYLVSFRDSLPPYSRWNSGRLEQMAAGDSARAVAFTYSWLGHARPAPAEEPVMRAEAEALLAEIRALCAPSAPPAPAACELVIPFRPSKPCAAE